MSQHFFTTEHHGKAVTIIMGYDRRLRHIFMSIIAASSDHAEDNSDGDAASLRDEDADFECFDVNDFRRIFERLQITIPESMFTEVMRDQNDNIGNRVVNHYLCGVLETIL